MFGKKEKIIATYEDKKAKDLNLAVGEAGRALRERVEKVIVCKDVIELYPEGPDKNKAIKDLEQAKYSLLCAIGHYDSALSEYKNYLIATQDKRVTTVYYNAHSWSTSHQIIENQYKHFVFKE